MSLVAYKTTADVVSKMVTLIVTVAAARALPAADFGVMALAMTSGWMLGVASDAGLPMYLATRVARLHASGARVVRTVQSVMRWRTALGGAAAAAGLLVGALLVPVATLAAFTLIVAHQLLGAMLDTLAHAYRGLGRTDIESSLSLAHRGAIALGALTVLALRPTLLWLSVALVVPPLMALIASHMIVRRLTGAGAVAGSDWSSSGQVRDAAIGASREDVPLSRSRFFSEAVPLGLGVLLSAVYFRCDVYFLERLHGVETVGIYNAGYRVVDALRLFPAAALAVAYPALCGATTLATMRRVAAALVAASLPVAAAVYAGAPALLALVYGETYAAGGDALRVLSLCLPLFFLNYALTHQVIAWEAQRAYLVIAACALAVNLIGNALLIPDGAMVGAAWSTLITEIVVAAGCVVVLRAR